MEQKERKQFRLGTIENQNLEPNREPNREPKHSTTRTNENQLKINDLPKLKILNLYPTLPFS